MIKFKLRFIISILLLLSVVLLCGCNEQYDALGTSDAVSVVGDYIYYINGVGSTPAENYDYKMQLGALCRMRKDGTDRQIILPMCIATYQIANDSIYAVILNSKNEYVIISSDLEGNNCKAISKMISGLFQYLNGYLYFQSAEGIVRTDVNGNNRTVIDPRTPTSTSLHGDYIYCTFADAETGMASLERIALDGSETVVIKESECYMMGSGKDGVYYLSREDSIFYQIDESGKSRKKIFTLYAEYSIDDRNGVAYGAKSTDDGNGLFRIDMNTGDTKKINEFACTDLVLTDKYIYFSNASDNGFLYRTSLTDNTTEIVTATVPISGRTYVIDGYVYYISPNERSRIYRIDETTLERVSLQYGY